MDSIWSLEALIAHCDALIESDPTHISKYRSWKTACRSVISMQPPGIQNDVRKLDPESAVKIYAGEYNPKPKTEREYRGRVNAALRSFLENMDSSPVALPTAEPSADVVSLTEPRGKPTRRALPKAEHQPASNTLTIPIRPDFLAQLILPCDITPAEARRLCKLIEVLPIDQQEAV